MITEDLEVDHNLPTFGIFDLPLYKFLPLKEDHIGIFLIKGRLKNS